ncbi:conserved hypothetical protein [Candidatus Desulfosporosinus infrequens]|uniref:Uncharacterized protein n=1 Tax=Candidatus Desulfosporosinus infrequens TaxID=2043169 RepID=A0A2U3LVT4_9FIRM|nr:conserved hypothetical protein [Candidatus Desulfosporosinus infrequens]
MTFVVCVVMIIVILLWRTDSRMEWSIPLKWQALIKAWKERLASRTHTFKYVWYSDSEYSELEKQFWHFKRALPRLQKKCRVPLWIEVNVQQSGTPGQKGTYISCLQRRFPEIEIYQCILCGGSGKDGNFTLAEENNQKERDSYEFFSDVK